MGNRWQQYEPSPEEVEAACDRIRESWPEAERLRRAVGHDSRPFEVQTVDYREVSQFIEPDRDHFWY